MSETKLAKYLRTHNFVPPTGQTRRRPVILSYSKGFSLRNNIISPFDQNIIWWCKKGVTIEQSFAWLKRNLPTKLYEIGDIALYVWLGTCNLTTKEKSSKYISITTDNSDTVDKVISCIDDIKNYIQDFPQVKLIFLEVPVYSIKAYNQHQKHSDPKTFKQQDETLANQVWQVNEKIRATNQILNTRSPNFSLFLQARKQHRTRSRVEAWEYFNYNLYRDGIHPGQNLARVWLREIAERIKIDCWSKSEVKS
ncbi:Hypothetical predicted protein [Mytilus galloprovincialis]|uniref:Uncharacterized protein n=1 Tax=Mytilus galloprovincialis TaxID=29158 RepID=A0A8B6CYX9_MYTGA|nr:Hypothetical predicted protein [Mytilus galloprovincialis]